MLQRARAVCKSIPRIVTLPVASGHRLSSPLQPEDLCCTGLTVKADLQIALPSLTSLANHVSKINLSQDSRSKLYINDIVSISAIKTCKRAQKQLISIHSRSESQITTSTSNGGNCNIHAHRAYLLFRLRDHRVYSAIDILSSQICHQRYIAARPTLKRSECVASRGSYDDGLCYGIPTDATVVTYAQHECHSQIFGRSKSYPGFDEASDATTRRFSGQP